jgi:hypothetical protein
VTCAVVIVGSIVAHYSTHVVLTRWFSRLESQEAQPEEAHESEATGESSIGMRQKNREFDQEKSNNLTPVKSAQSFNWREV